VKYSDEILDEIRNRLDIVEVVSEYVPLKGSGKSFKGLCPFHQEKTPSFVVDRDKQIFHCFGCGEGGNIFSFIMKIEKMNFPEAVKLLADKAGIALPVYNRMNDQVFQKRGVLLEINKVAADYFQRNLYSNQGKMALEYLSKRYFKNDVLRIFQIGYALPGYDYLSSLLVQKKFQLSDILKAGLVIKSRKTSSLIDYFRDRVIFPITDIQGRVIAFGGRVIGNKLPKYINSPETLIYVKSNNLYGLFQAKDNIRQNSQVIIVEGYTDVLMAYQYGIKNVVASLGTALTRQQVNLVKRYADEVIIAFDSDSAGKNATLRGLGIAKKEGLKVRVISLPEGKDPVETLLEKGGNYFSDLINNALPLIDYKLEVLTQQYNQKTNEGKIDIVKRIFPDLADIGSQIELQMEVKKIAEKLRIEEEIILKDLKKFRKGSRELPNLSIKNKTESTHVNAEKILIAGILHENKYAKKIFSEIKVSDFSVIEHREIVSVINHLFKKGEKINLQKVMDSIEKKDQINLLSGIIFKDVVVLNDEAINRSIRAIKRYQLQVELEKIKNKIKEEEVTKKEVNPELLNDYQNILRKIQTIAL